MAPQFDLADDFHGNYACAWLCPEGMAMEEAVGGWWGFDRTGLIDRSGQWVLEPAYHITLNEDAGFFLIYQFGPDGSNKGCMEGFFDIPSGCFSGLRYSQVSLRYTDSRLIAVTDPDSGLYGYADRSTGEMVIPGLFSAEQEPTGFVDGVAFGTDAVTGELLMIDLHGRPILLPEGIRLAEGIPPTEGAYLPADGRILIEYEAGLYGYADLTGHIVVTPQYRAARAFSDGLAAVQLTADEWGYIDPEGSLVLRGFGYAGDFLGGCADVDRQEEGHVLIDRNGQIVPARFMENGLAWAADPTAPALPWMQAVYLVDRSGQRLSDTYWVTNSMALTFEDGPVPVWQGNDRLYLGQDGSIAIPGPFTEAEPFRDGLARVRTGDRMGYVDPEGNEVYFWPTKYRIWR